MSAKKKKGQRPASNSPGARNIAAAPAAPTPGRASTGRLRAIQLFIGIALAVSLYLAFLSITGGRAVGCGPESGCDKVLNSRWAYWFGIPVSLLAVVVDTILLTATFRLTSSDAAAQRKTWSLILPCAILVAGAALWFVILQAAVVRSFCPYCMVAHGSGFIAALLILLSAPLRPPPEKPWEHERTVYVTPGFFRRLTIIAVLGLAGLVAGQIVYKPASFVVRNVDSLMGSTNAPAAATKPSSSSSTQSAALSMASVAPTNPNPSAPSIPAPPPLTTPSAAPANPSIAPATAAGSPSEAGAPRLFPVFNGRFQVDMSKAPTIGSPTNAHVVLSQFDYTCHHCRVMHPLILSAQKMFENRLVIISLPMPLDPACNRLMQRANPKHANACEFAALGLAVWQANRSKHHSFDEWMFASTEPPPIEEARQFASQLIGPDALNQAISDPWVQEQLRQSIAIYETAARAGQGSMPQLHIGEKVAVGTLAMSDLMNLLATNLGLRQ